MKFWESKQNNRLYQKLKQKMTKQQTNNNESEMGEKRKPGSERPDKVAE
jgi:hypothetical protein